MTDTITTELRESMVDDARGLLYIGETALADLCDAIDAAHASLEAENASLRRELDRVLGEQEDRDGWIELPKDMNGEHIHIDDVMEWPDHTDDPFEVIGIGNGTLYYVEDGEIQWTRAETKRHYHATAVEDVMAAFAIDWESAQDGEDKTAVLKEYAKLLALAGDAE